MNKEFEKLVAKEAIILAALIVAVICVFLVVWLINTPTTVTGVTKSRYTVPMTPYIEMVKDRGVTKL